jgi:2-iminobutanoate/2-iminopropanoate deaminase
LRRLLQAGDASLDDVVSCLVHLTDLGNFPAFNAEYEKYFPNVKPVRTTVRADLVAGVLVEVTVIAKSA